MVHRCGLRWLPHSITCHHDSIVVTSEDNRLNVVSAYRTVSGDAARLLARHLSLVLVAQTRQRIYQRVCDLKGANLWSAVAEKEIREQKNLFLHKQWVAYLNRLNAPGICREIPEMPYTYLWRPECCGDGVC